VLKTGCWLLSLFLCSELAAGLLLLTILVLIVSYKKYSCYLQGLLLVLELQNCLLLFTNPFLLQYCSRWSL